MWKLLGSGTVLAIVCLPLLADAQGVVRLTGLPFEADGNSSIQAYIQALYWLAIGVGASLAVLRLVLAGAKYMLTDVVTQKGEAKKDVQAAVIGLLIILATVLILETINPQLNNFNVLELRGANVPRGYINPIDNQIQNYCANNNGCVRERCPFVRGFVTCRTWCENRNGIHVDNGALTAAECIMAPTDSNQVQIGEERVTGSFGCSLVTVSEFPEYDCSDAIANCNTVANSRFVENGNTISCFRSLTAEEVGDNLGTETRRIDCERIVGDGFSGTIYNCSSARTQCRDRGEVVRGEFEGYVECSG